jgi:Tol biopolymer transport system component
VKRLAALVLGACALAGACASSAGALPGSIIVSQLWLYDNPDGCNEEPCGFYQMWSGRPGGPYAQMLGLGRHESYGDYMAPTVSPTGTQIVYATSDGTLMIAGLNAATGSQTAGRMLTPRARLPDAPTTVAWSPDGRRLLLMEGFHGKGLWVVDADGGGLHRLPCRCRISVEEGYGVTWSRGGIAFAGLVGGRTVIQVVQPDGSDLHAVTSPPGGRDSYGDARPAWSPTGSQIAFTRGDGGDPRNGSGVVYVVSARGGTPRRVGPGAAPMFSPHGRYLAYADRFDSSLAPRALHIADLRKPSRRVTLPGVLATTGFLDQLTWLP